MTFMKNLIAELLNLTDKEKAEVFLLMFVLASCAAVVMLGISWSRGNDVEYFKERIILMDQRMTVIDKKIHDEGQRIDKVAEYSNETRRVLESEIQRNVEQDRWIEEWKKLPQLPKPKHSQR
jgi:hypothetical protein